MAELRLAIMHDVPTIMVRLAAVQKISDTGGKYGDLIDAELAIRYAIHCERAFIWDNVFFFVEVGELWYSTGKVMFEQLVLKLGRMTGTFEEFVDQFDIVAKRLGCASIVVGDSQAGTMVPRYEQAGYKQQAIQLIKEVR